MLVASEVKNAAHDMWAEMKVAPGKGYGLVQKNKVRTALVIAAVSLTTAYFVFPAYAAYVSACAAKAVSFTAPVVAGISGGFAAMSMFVAAHPLAVVGLVAAVLITVPFAMVISNSLVREEIRKNYNDKDDDHSVWKAMKVVPVEGYELVKKNKEKTALVIAAVSLTTAYFVFPAYAAYVSAYAAKAVSFTAPVVAGISGGFAAMSMFVAAHPLAVVGLVAAVLITTIVFNAILSKLKSIETGIRDVTTAATTVTTAATTVTTAMNNAKDVAITAMNEATTTAMNNAKDAATTAMNGVITEINASTKLHDIEVDLQELYDCDGKGNHVLKDGIDTSEALGRICMIVHSR